MVKTNSADVTLDRRSSERRTGEQRREESVAVAVERRQSERRKKVPRRRQIDPTTCERDYDNEEIEFMQALDEYKRNNGRMFPTCSEILEVLKSLGYRRSTETAVAYEANEPVDEDLSVEELGDNLDREFN